MTIKLNSIARWTAVDNGSGVALNGRGHRKVRIDFLSENDRRIYLVRADGEVRFLAFLEAGHTCLEFMDEGNLLLSPDDDGGELWAYTSEFEAAHVVVPDAVTFTKIAQRRTRNPELEHMMWLQQQNIDRRFAALENDYKAQLEKVRNGTGIHGSTAAEHKEPNSGQAGAVEPDGSAVGAGNVAPAGGSDESGAKTGSGTASGEISQPVGAGKAPSANSAARKEV